MPRAEKTNPVGQPNDPITHWVRILLPIFARAMPASSGISVVARAAFWVPITASGIEWNLPPLPPRLLSVYPWPPHRNQVRALIIVAPLIWQASEATFEACPNCGLKPIPEDTNTPMPFATPFGSSDKVETVTFTALALYTSTNSSLLPFKVVPGPFSLKALITKQSFVLDGALVTSQAAT